MIALNLLREMRVVPRHERAFNRMQKFFGREPVAKVDRVSVRHEGRRTVYCGDCGHSSNIFDICQWCHGYAVPLLDKAPRQHLILDVSGVPIG